MLEEGAGRERGICNQPLHFQFDMCDMEEMDKEGRSIMSY